MEKKLNPQKVITEIDLLLEELDECLKKKKDFEDLHKKSIQLCKVILNVKKDYKTVDVPYPKPVVIVFADFSGKKAKETEDRLEIPDKKQQWSQKKDLLEKLISVLKEARDIYSLRLKLLED